MIFKPVQDFKAAMSASPLPIAPMAERLSRLSADFAPAGLIALINVRSHQFRWNQLTGRSCSLLSLISMSALSPSRFKHLL